MALAYHRTLMLPARLTRAVPFLAHPRPSGALLRSEALAGLTVGLMMIPQSVAYAHLAGMPPVTGIYASILPALVAVFFSSSQRLSVGPTALSALLISASLTGMAQPGSAEWIQLAVWLALLTGLLQVVLGWARFGWLLNLVNAPVLMAFTQAAAVLIITSQIPSLLGFGGGWRHMWHTPSFDWASAVFGVATLALLMGARRWRPGFPTVLVIVLATAAISHLAGFEAHGGKVVGTLPSGLPGLYVPGWIGWDRLGQLILPVLVITLVSFLETASSAKVDSERKGERWDQDQDLIGQGLAKIASGFSGAFATSSSFSRSALNLYAGAQTGWATIFSTLVVLLALLFFTPVLRPVPQSVLAAIVVAAVIGLLKPREFRRLWRLSRVESVIAGVTFLVTLLAAPALYWGVLTGVVMSLSLFLYQRLHPRIIELGMHPDGSLRDRHLWQLPPLAPQTYALRMDAALDFAAAGQFERNVIEYLTEHPHTRHVFLFAQSINRIDATGVEVFLRLMSQLQQRDVELHLVGLKLPVEKVLLAAGALAPHPKVHVVRTENEGLAALKAIERAAQRDPGDLPAAAI